MEGSAGDGSNTATIDPVARQIRARLVGARYELEESIHEAIDSYPDPLLRAHLDGALVDVEGAVQRLQQLLPSA